MKTTDTPEPWWRRHIRWLAAVAIGYPVLLFVLWQAGMGGKWTEATTAYFVAINLVVLWWYADTTCALHQTSQRQIAVSERQYAIAWRTHREANKPFVIVERMEDTSGGFRYYVRNIGPGIAVNVWLVQLEPNGQLARQLLGPMAPLGSKILPGRLQGDLCNQDGLFRFALFAEALITRTAQWTATVNARERRPGGEMVSAVLTIEPRKEFQTIEQVLGPMHGQEWHRLERALHDIMAGL